MGVFSLVIYWCISVSCKHLFIFSLSWIDVKFLNQNPWMPARPGVLQFRIFFCGALSESRWMFALGSSSSIWKLFFHGAFQFGFFIKIPPFPHFDQNLLSHPVARMSSHISPLLAGRIFFRWFGMSCFFLYCLVTSRYLFNILSFPSTFWFISSSYVFYSNCVTFFSFCPNLSCFPSVLSSLLAIVTFLSMFPI